MALSAADLVGTWRLVKAFAVDDRGRQVPPPYGGEHGMGRLIFSANGRMMCVNCDGRTTMPPGETREYVSYCGNYTFDGKQLVTEVDAASDDERRGTAQVRDVRFEGDLLVLRPPVRTGSGQSIQRELWWERIAAV